jgi:hypothetical protein
MTRTRSILVLVVAVALAGPAATVSATPPASPVPLPSPAPAANPAPKHATSVNDVDGDGAADLVGLVSGQGVRVLYANRAPQTVTREQLGDPEAEDTVFGGGFTVADLNADGYADILVSDWTMNDYRGVVWAIWGSADGISAKHVTVLLKGTDHQHPVGSSLAFVPRPEPVLAVGTAPAEGNGGVLLYRVEPSGRLGAHRFLTIGSPGLHDPGSDLQFGRRAAASGDLLALGAPNAGTGDYRGAVWVFQLLPGLRYWVTKVTQDTSGVPGRSEDADAFGSDVSMVGDWVVVSVPGETVRGTNVAGAVQPLEIVRTPHGLRVHAERMITAHRTGQKAAVDGRREIQAGWICLGIPGVLINAGPVAVPLFETPECEDGLQLPEGRLAGVLRSGTQGLDVPVTVTGSMLSLGWSADVSTRDPSAPGPALWDVRQAVFAAPIA